MNAETARLLATALKMRAEAEAALLVPDASSARVITMARMYVHEQRVINRILSEDADEE